MKFSVNLLAGTCLIAIFAAAEATRAQTTGTDGSSQAVVDAELLADGGIIVTGERLRGQLQVEQAPVLELDEADIEGIGANSIAELLTVISPQTGSSRGRGGGGPPAILVNGIRISSFRELRSYPPEAIIKVEVLPEEVAQRFGFPPDRRVVNMILKDNYSSRELEVEYEGPSDGGYAAREAEFSLLKIDRGSRFNVAAEVRDTTLLNEAERDVIQTEGALSDIPGDPDPARFRSLVPDQLQAEATVNWTRSDIDTGSLLSLNGTYERNESRSLSGLNSVLLTDPLGDSALRVFGAETPLERRTDTDTLSLGSTYSHRLGLFDLTGTADAVLVESETQIDQRFDTQALVDAAASGTLALDGELPSTADAGFDTARNRTLTSTNKLTVRGNPVLLPAGEVSTTFDLGFDWKRIESDDTRTALETKLTRRRLEAGTNIAVPIAEAGGAWGLVGDLTFNLSGGFEDLSDFGTLYDGSAGLTWGLADNLTLSATYIYTEVPPSLTQLGSPRVETFNVPVFDFVTGESVLASVISGGNPELAAEAQKDWKFAANWELPFWDDTRFSLEYIRNRSSDVTSGFPALMEAIEAAFPNRVTRAAPDLAAGETVGQLIAIDQRPVTFERTRSERLVFWLTTRGSFGEARPRGEGSGAGNGRRQGGPPGTTPEGPPPTAPQGAPSNASPARAAPPPGRFSRGFGSGRGRYFVNLTHTIELDNTILIAEGVPVLDQLDGASTGSFGFARHSSRLEAGVFRQGKGLRISGRYTGKARIDGTGLPGSSDLFFGDLATIDLRVFFNLGQLLGQEGTFLNNMRLSLRADNVFNAKRRVEDETGAVPLAYQPALIDPTGRFIGIDIRKMF